jgi:cytidine deaminase
MKCIQNRIKRLKEFLMQFPYVHQRFRVGAMIIDKRGRIKSISSNSYSKTHPIMTSNFYTQKSYIHAEIAAILSADIKKTDSILVVRIGANGSLLPSRPCDGCMRYITECTDIKSVIYVNDVGEVTTWIVSRNVM